jgi:hypothetical protein
MALAAPAIIRTPGLLMPVKPIVIAPPIVVTGYMVLGFNAYGEAVEELVYAAPGGHTQKRFKQITQIIPVRGDDLLPAKVSKASLGQDGILLPAKVSKASLGQDGIHEYDWGACGSLDALSPLERAMDDFDKNWNGWRKRAA